ncbi:MAG: ABC transporter substrate-binding protein [Chthoniobacterales bacterium]
MRKALSSLVATLALSIFPGCDQVSPSGKPLRIGIETWAGYGFAYLAQDKGFYEKHGVEVELVFAEDSETSRERFAHREIEGWFDVLPEAVTGHASGIPARVVWVVDYSDSADVLVGEAAITNVKDLAGKKIGIEGVNTFSHMFAIELLGKHGVPEEMIQFEIVNPMDVHEALEEGKIAAGHTWEPITTDALASGYHVIGKAGEIPGCITDVLFMNPTAIAERPEEIQAVVAALAEAVDYWKANPAESLEIMAAHEKMTAEQLAADLGGLHILDRADNRDAMLSKGSQNCVYRATSRIIDFFSDRGQLVSRPEADQLIEPRFVRALTAPQ